MTVHTVPRATKEAIRQARDQAVRARRDELIDLGQLEVCARCGADRENQTVGCKTCHDRTRRQVRRGDPAFLKRERERQQKARDRRAEAQRARRAREVGSVSLPSRPEASLGRLVAAHNASGRTPDSVQSLSATNRQSKGES